MNKRNNIIIAGIVGVAFILFVIFVYLPYADKQENLNKVKQSYQHSSFLRDSLNHIPDFTCVDQNGKTFTKKDVAETVFVAEFFYTECDAYYDELLKQKIWISSFPYPNPKSKPITRLVLSALHTKDDIEKLTDALKTTTT